MAIFISHTTADDYVARQVYDRLTRQHSITCYLDDLDRQGSSTNVTALVVRRLKDCTNLLALVTQNTKSSWWVPFEVGVAREAPRIITTFTNLESNGLPAFLKEWPVLRGNNAIDTFANYYKQQAPALKRTMNNKLAAAAEGMEGVESFHRQLKAALGQ